MCDSPTLEGEEVDSGGHCDSRTTWAVALSAFGVSWSVALILKKAHESSSLLAIESHCCSRLPARPSPHPCSLDHPQQSSHTLQQSPMSLSSLPSPSSCCCHCHCLCCPSGWYSTPICRWRLIFDPLVRFRLLICCPYVCEYDWPRCQRGGSWVSRNGMRAIFGAVGYCWVLISSILSVVLAIVKGIRLCTVVDVDAVAVARLWQCPRDHYIKSRAKNYFHLIFIPYNEQASTSQVT